MYRCENLITSYLSKYVITLCIVIGNFIFNFANTYPAAKASYPVLKEQLLKHQFSTNSQNTQSTGSMNFQMLTHTAINLSPEVTTHPSPSNISYPTLSPSVPSTINPDATNTNKSDNENNTTPTPTPTPTPDPNPDQTPTPTENPVPTNIPTPTVTITPTQSPTPTYELVFSEINWSGSSLGGHDEWIELYNNSSNQIKLSDYYIEGALRSGKKIYLSGTLEPNEYYLIAKQDFDVNKTRLTVTPDHIENKLSLSNSGFNLKILKKAGNAEQIVDEVNTNESKPFAGKVTTNLHASMERVDYMSSGNDPTNWKTATTKLNLKQNYYLDGKCHMDYGTPKGKFDVQKHDTVMYFWDICTYDGNLNSSGKLEVLNFSGTLFEKTFRINEKLQKIRLVGRAEGEKFNIGKLTVTGNDGMIIEKKIFNSDIFTKNNGVVLFVSSRKSNTNIKIQFDLELNNEQKIILEKVQVDEIDDIPYQISYLVGTFDTQGNVLTDSFTEEKVLKNNPENDEILFDETIPFSSEKYKAIKIEILAKTDHFLANNEFNELLVLNIFNSHNLETHRKSFKQKDFENEFYYLSFVFKLTSKGIPKISIQTQKGANLTIKEIKISNLKQDDRKSITFDLADYVTSKNYSYDRALKGIFIQTGRYQEKAITLNSDNICNMPYCEIEIPITLVNSTNEQVMKVYFGTKGSTRSFYVNKIKKNDFDENKKFILKLNKSVEENEKILISIILEPNASIVIHKGLFRYIDTKKGDLVKLNSLANRKWESLNTLNSKSSASGQNGQLIDILATNAYVDPGTYLFSYKINKLENYNSGKDLLLIRGVDSSGYKLFEFLIDENDLEWENNTLKKINFDIKTSKRIYVFIHYYGNHSGAQSDVDIGEFELRQI